MLSPRGVSTHAHISFAGPVMATDLTKGEMMPVLIGIARRLLENHLASWRIPFLPSGPLP
jgi:hypothetical protein